MGNNNQKGVDYALLPFEIYQNVCKGTLRISLTILKTYRERKLEILRHHILNNNNENGEFNRIPEKLDNELWWTAKFIGECCFKINANNNQCQIDQMSTIFANMAYFSSNQEFIFYFFFFVWIC